MGTMDANMTQDQGPSGSQSQWQYEDLFVDPSPDGLFGDQAERLDVHQAVDSLASLLSASGEQSSCR